MKKMIGVLTIVMILASVAFVQATVTLAPKVPAPTQKVVVLMFDDGWLTQYTNALPILQSYGYNASFAIYPKAQDGQYPDYMSWAQVENLSNAGYDVESHTYSHLILTDLSASVLQSELVNSKQVLLAHGIQSGALIYPEGEGVTNDTVKQAAQNAGYLLARGTDEGIIDVNNVPDYYALPSYPLLNTTDMAYFESSLYNVQGSNIAILLYHKISDTNIDQDTVTVGDFTQQMAYLHDNGFTVESLSEVFFDETPLPTPTPTPIPTATPTPTPPTPTPTPTPPAPTPTPTASPTPTVTPTSTPITTPNPTVQPTTNPTDTPTSTPNHNPTVTETPSASPTPTPTANPTGTNDAPASHPNNEISSGTALLIVGSSAASVLVGAILIRTYASKKARLSTAKPR